jgi:hypothetical protein
VFGGPIPTVKAVTMGMVTAITLFWSNMPNPAIGPYIEPPRSSSGYFKPLLDPGGRFASETASRRFYK